MSVEGGGIVPMQQNHGEGRIKGGNKSRKKKKKYSDSSSILPVSPLGQIYQNPVGRADKEI